LVAKLRAIASRPSLRKLTVNLRECWIAGSVAESLSTQIRISGGVRETEQKALIVSPTGRSPRSSEVTTATPAGKFAITSRKRPCATSRNPCSAAIAGLSLGEAAGELGERL